MMEHSPNNINQTVDFIAEELQRHIIFENKTHGFAISLWIAGTYLMDNWGLYPKLYINSPERECGKTSLLCMIEAFAYNARMAAAITPSAFYRIIQSEAPTLLIDEADRTLRGNEELNGIINAGHTRRTAVKILSEPTPDGKWKSVEMSLWAPQAFAGIGTQADTLLSRSIKIKMRRKMVSEEVATIPIDYFEQHHELRQCLKAWSDRDGKSVAELKVTIPKNASDRAIDNWRPMFQIANTLMNEWPERVLTAFTDMEVNNKESNPLSEGTELLTDLRLVIESHKSTEVPAAELLSYLLMKQDSEWFQHSRGRPITQKWLSRMLQGYGVYTERRRHANVYEVGKLQEAFVRYLP
jgi:hypothetical protein